jgi:hypothetical protein
MRLSRLIGAFTVAILVTAFTSCNSTNSATTPSTTPVTSATPVVNKTDTFQGVLNPNGGVTNQFTASVAGGFIATLVSVQPDSTLPIGFGVGVVNGANCQLQALNDTAAEGAIISANLSSAGSYCVRVYDASGTVMAPENFVVTVFHPQ